MTQSILSHLRLNTSRTDPDSIYIFFSYWVCLISLFCMEIFSYIYEKKQIPPLLKYYMKTLDSQAVLKFEKPEKKSLVQRGGFAEHVLFS